MKELRERFDAAYKRRDWAEMQYVMHLVERQRTYDSFFRPKRTRSSK